MHVRIAYKLNCCKNYPEKTLTISKLANKVRACCPIVEASTD